MKMRIDKPVTLNVTGYDLEPKAFDRGVHEIPALGLLNITAWLGANPSYGVVLTADEASGAGASDEAPTPSADSEASAATEENEEPDVPAPRRRRARA